MALTVYRDIHNYLEIRFALILLNTARNLAN